MKYRYVGVGGDDTSNLCGMSESAPCKTVGHAVESSMAQLSSTITLLGGKHVSEGATISVGEKKIIITGRGKTVSVFGTNSLSSPATTLFSISSGQLEVGHVGIDHNATRSSSPSVLMVSLFNELKTHRRRAQPSCANSSSVLTPSCSMPSSTAIYTASLWLHG